MKRRVIWLSSAFLAVLLLVPILYDAYNDYEVYRFGSIVKVTIAELPRKSSDDIKFNFDGKVYSKSTDGEINYATVKLGDTITLNYLKGYEDFFLFPNANPFSSLIIAFCIVTTCMVCFSYYGLRKTPPPVSLFGQKIS